MRILKKNKIKILNLTEFNQPEETFFLKKSKLIIKKPKINVLDYTIKQNYILPVSVNCSELKQKIYINDFIDKSNLLNILTYKNDIRFFNYKKQKFKEDLQLNFLKYKKQKI